MEKYYKIFLRMLVLIFYYLYLVRIIYIYIYIIVLKIKIKVFVFLYIKDIYGNCSIKYIYFFFKMYFLIYRSKYWLLFCIINFV